MARTASRSAASLCAADLFDPHTVRPARPASSQSALRLLPGADDDRVHRDSSCAPASGLDMQAVVVDMAIKVTPPTVSTPLPPNSSMRCTQPVDRPRRGAEPTGVSLQHGDRMFRPAGVLMRRGPLPTAHPACRQATRSISPVIAANALRVHMADTAAPLG